jgi:hypothetical protein
MAEMTPRILLVATSSWFATARLARAFRSAQCEVEIVCPLGHPVTSMRAAPKRYPYLFFAPLHSIDSAILAARPDLVIPCDDRARSHLVRLYRRAERAAASTRARRALLEDSLGEPSTISVPTARTAFVALAQELGIRAPATSIVRTREELRKWLSGSSFPVVLKTDESYGGRGVRIVDSFTDADRARRALRTPPSLRRAIKRAIVNRDMNYIMPCLCRTRPVVNVQAFVSGQDANCTVACWKGAVLASVTVSVLQTVDSLGPASVIRLVENREISTAAEMIIRRLKLSGLIGLDFILEQETGEAYLIEVNPRATQICHLQLGAGHDLLGPLRASISGHSPRQAVPITDNDVIALFPQEWARDSTSGFLGTAYHDVPWDEPDLLRRCMTETIEFRTWSRLSTAARVARDWLTHAEHKRLGHASRSGVSHV